MKGYAPPNNIVIRESLDDDISDDVEDDVFIRDGKNSRYSDEKGLKRPLMAPRRHKYAKLAPIMRKRTKCWKCCEPFCYGLAAITILLALIFLAALLLTMFPVSLQKIKIWIHKNNSVDPAQMLYNGDIGTSPIENVEYVACSQITVNTVWRKSLPKMASESPTRKSDLNGDGVEDIIIGYGIDLDEYSDNIAPTNSKKMTCFSSRSGDTVVTCEGGILALNGVTGDVIWQRWTAFNVFSIFCNVDLNGNTKNDCVASGRGGLIIAINGETGNLIWTLKENSEDIPESELVINLYTVNPIRDLNNDGIVDVMAVHVEENDDSRTGHIRLISGSNGKLLYSILTPFNEEVFVPLQVLTTADGLEQLLILTGGQNTPGGVYITSLERIMKNVGGNVDYLTIYRNRFSGFMSPAILTDINLDGIQDMVLASFNSTVYAFDGKTYQMIWNYTFPFSESVSSIVPGFFDHDNVTDFMIKYNTGPGFPIYYYSQTLVLSGVNGSILMDSPIIDSGGSNNLLGGISITQKIKSTGDYFLHWQIDCGNRVKTMDAYQFIPESTIVEQSRADTCFLRYNESSVVKLYALSRHIKPPGFLLFSSENMNLNFTTKYDQSGQIRQPSKMGIKHSLIPKKVKSRVEKKMQMLENDPTDQQMIGSEIKRVDAIETNNFNAIKKQKNHKSKEPLRNLFQLPNQQRRKPKPYPYLQDPQNTFQDYSSNDQKMNSFSFDMDPDFQEKLNELENEEGFLGDFPSLDSQYPTNRDVRSKDMENLMSLENIISTEDQNLTMRHSFDSEIHDDSQTVKKVLKEDLIKTHFDGHAETLWDLEMEKEALDAIKENGNVDYPFRQRRANEQPKISASISSTGALLRSLKESNNIDFVFTMNVRESEAYPPLLLPEDLSCVEEKVKTYQRLQDDQIQTLEKQFLEECLVLRLKDTIIPKRSSYESQLVITRISISCTCNELSSGEVCSTFDSIEKQKWTQFMGNEGNGLYS